MDESDAPSLEREPANRYRLEMPCSRTIVEAAVVNDCNDGGHRPSIQWQSRSVVEKRALFSSWIPSTVRRFFLLAIPTESLSAGTFCKSAPRRGFPFPSLFTRQRKKPDRDVGLGKQVKEFTTGRRLGQKGGVYLHLHLYLAGDLSTASVITTPATTVTLYNQPLSSS